MAEARHIGAGQMGQLRVGYTESGIFHPDLLRIFVAFRSAYPDVDMVLDEQVSTTQLAMLTAGELDIAFIRPPLPPDPSLSGTLLLREPMAVALPTAHRLVGRRSLQLDDLAGETFIFFPRRVRPGLAGTVIAACEAAGFTPKMGQTAPQVTSAMRLVAAGSGISIVPASMATMAMDGVRVRKLNLPTLRAEIAVVLPVAARSIPAGNMLSIALAIAHESSSFAG